MVEQVSDFKMPEKIVTRLIKDALPEDVTLSKDAKNAACRFAGIFLLQLSMAAAEKAQLARRRTLDNQDIMQAMFELGLPECVPQLVRFGAQRKRNAKRKESNMIKGKHRKALNLDTEAHQHQLQQESEFHNSMTDSNGVSNQDVYDDSSDQQPDMSLDEQDKEKLDQEPSFHGDEDRESHSNNHEYGTFNV